MKKCVLIYLGRKGAGPEYAIEMTKALAKQSKVLCVISSYVSNISQWNELDRRNDNIQVYQQPTYQTLQGFIINSLKFWNYLQVVKAINRFQPDFIYSPMGHFWEKMIVPFCKCKRTIQTIHDVALHEGENGWKHRISQKIFSYKTTKYVILSKAFKEEMEMRGVDKKNILVIPHAVFKGYQTKAQLEDYKQYNRFLFFGRVIKYKGIEVLLSAMDGVVQCSPNAILVIAGDGDVAPYKKLLERHKLNIDLHLKWIEDSEVQNYFKDIDFVVVPYTHASQSGVIPLAYAFGKPVIATKIGGLPEQVEEGKTGLLIAAGSGEQLSDCICQLLSSPDLLAQMKKNCYQYAKDNTWESSAELILNAF